MSQQTNTPAVVPQRQANNRRLRRWLFVAGIVLMMAWVLFPIYLLAVNSFSTSESINAWPKKLVPDMDFSTLMFFLRYQGIYQALLNSIGAALVTMFVAIAVGAPGGYALARFRFKGSGAYRILIMMTRAFPLPLLAIPIALVLIKIGLDDTIFGVGLVHSMLALPFSVLITFSLFASIPVELEEAAWIFGCTRFQAFMKVVFPLVAPGVAASAIFAFVTSWNEVFAASVLTLNNQTLTSFLIQNIDRSPIEVKFVGGLILILPPLVFIFIVRKYLFSMWGISQR